MNFDEVNSSLYSEHELKHLSAALKIAVHMQGAVGSWLYNCVAAVSPQNISEKRDELGSSGKDFLAGWRRRQRCVYEA